MYDQHGDLLGVLGIGRDISRSKQTLKESEEKQAFLNMVVDRSPVPMLICSPSWTALRANQAFYNAFNLTAEQTIGKYNLLHDDNLKRADTAEKLDLVLHKKQPVKFDLLWKSDLVRVVDFSGGRHPYIDVSIFPLLNQNGEMTHIVVQWVDITDRKEAEKTLREREKRYRVLIEQTGDCMLMHDLSGNLIDVNDFACATYGYMRQEMLKMTIADIDPDSV